MRHRLLQQRFKTLPRSMTLLEVGGPQPDTLLGRENLQSVGVDGTGAFIGTFLGALKWEEIRKRSDISSDH